MFEVKGRKKIFGKPNFYTRASRLYHLIVFFLLLLQKF